jgi:septal ring factor EnvC (AmiA/AmiB activator)
MNMNVKILSKNVTLVDGKIIVRSEREEQLSPQDIAYMQGNIKRQKKQLVEQSKRLKEQYDNLTAQEEEITNMITLLGTQETPVPEEQPVVLEE